jgi:tetratricopeptide (TPR) repeat protein
VLGALIFLPGKSGPLVFDDASNLLNNSYVQINSLDLETLYRASTSLEAGPLKRPVSMLSFALNHYFVGSFDDSTPYKLTNIVIHAVNGLLLFWMMSLVLLRITQLQPRTQPHSGINRNTYLVVASVVALLWVMHPIQLTSVLYVVQRMTELSGLFTLLALICYLSGRHRMIAGKPGGVGLILWGTVVFGALGMFSKETAALLPVFMLVLELTLFSTEQPWRQWPKLPVKMRWVLVLTGVIASLAVLGWAIHYSLPKYVFRDFDMTERVLTESRILFYYLSLILVPRLDQFSLFHDDIELSTSVLSPWTTLPSLAGIVFLLSLAYLMRRRQPLLSLGIFWFFAGHLLESTILPLELAHEHRNYLASLGPLLVVVHGIDAACMKLQRRWLWSILPLFMVVVAAVSNMRATQWTNDYSLFLYESSHHPHSASITSGFALRLIEVGKYKEGMQAFRRAADLAPEEPSYILFMNMFAARAGEKFDQTGAKETLRRLATGRITATTGQAMQYLGECILSWCQSLNVEMEVWMKTLLNRQDQTGVDKSYVNSLLARSLFGQGRIDEAIAAYNLSHEMDKNYLHPLLELAYLYAREGDGENARETIHRLREANRTARFPQTKQIEKTEKEIEKLLNHPQAIKQKR